ncbi:MAG: hypothetical protein ACTHNQ_04270 [Microbacterium sp.]|uniref:hypothetical protein n=1 Tax=Microbacterium sp. TaxID=51671 RepID=UPI003F809865
MKAVRAAIIVIALLPLTACAAGGTVPESSSEPTASRPPFERVTPAPTDETTTGAPADVSQARWDAIVADLAARGVTGTPVLVSAVAVTWNSGALGCPQPGNSYTQAVVDGMRVIVDVDGTSYDYRFGRSDSPRLCER